MFMKSLCDCSSIRLAVLEALGGQIRSEAKLEVGSLLEPLRRPAGPGGEARFRSHGSEAQSVG